MSKEACDELTENESLHVENERLRMANERLISEYERLQSEYKENVIIQSMNDMKSRYDRLLQTTVPNHKYNVLYEKYTKLVKYITTCSVLLDHMYKGVQTLRGTYQSPNASQTTSKIESEIDLIRELLQESLDNVG